MSPWSRCAPSRRPGRRAPPSLHPGGNLCQQRHVTRGDARAALAQSKYVVTQSYRTPSPSTPSWSRMRRGLPLQGRGEGLYLRPGVYDTRKEISIMLGWEPERIVVENKLVGAASAARRTCRCSTWRCWPPSG